MKEVLQELGQNGVEIEKGLERLMNSEDLYARVLFKFLDDTTYSEIMQAIAAGDADAAEKAVHTLKGVAANLELTPIFAVTEEMMKHFRAGNPEGAFELTGQLQEGYEKIIAIIKKYT